MLIYPHLAPISSGPDLSKLHLWYSLSVWLSIDHVFYFRHEFRRVLGDYEGKIKEGLTRVWSPAMLLLTPTGTIRAVQRHWGS